MNVLEMMGTGIAQYDGLKPGDFVHVITRDAAGMLGHMMARVTETAGASVRLNLGTWFSADNPMVLLAGLTGVVHCDNAINRALAYQHMAEAAAAANSLRAAAGQVADFL